MKTKELYGAKMPNIGHTVKETKQQIQKIRVHRSQNRATTNLYTHTNTHTPLAKQSGGFKR